MRSCVRGWVRVVYALRVVYRTTHRFSNNSWRKRLNVGSDPYFRPHVARHFAASAASESTHILEGEAESRAAAV